MKIIFSILFLSLGISLFSQADTAKWDPSDPNCPCHKLANQADEEWKRMQEADLKAIANNTNLNADTAKVNVKVNGNVNVTGDSSVAVQNVNPVLTQNNFQPGKDSIPATTTTTDVGSAGSSGGSSYYHYSAILFEWKYFWKGVRNYRRKMGTKHSGKFKHSFRVANCFEF